jgi:acetylornithine/N-succinyldiaminopimelate aminotransferase
MMVAKGIGGGFPIGAILATQEAASGMTAGTHGSTYGGNPLGCAVGSAVLATVSDPAFLMDVARKAAAMRQGLEGLVSQFSDVFDGVTGSGLMLGLRCSASKADVVNAGYDVGVLTVPAAENVVRLLPPLNILDEDIIIALEKLEKASHIVRAAL